MYKLFLLLNPVYATLFWAVLLNTVKPLGNEPKTFLSKFFVVACCTFIAHLLYFLPLPGIYVYVDSFYLLTHLLIFPMYYIYVRLLAIDRRFSWQKHYIHFVAPVMLIALYAVCDLCMSKAERIDFIYNKLIDGDAVTGVFLYRKIVYNVTRAAFIVQGLVYMTRSILAVQKNRKNVVNFYSNTEEDSLDKVHWLNITVSVTMTTCIIMEMLGKERFTGHDFFLLAPSVIFTVMLFCIGWLGHRQRSVLLIDIDDAVDDNQSGSQGADERKESKSKNTHLKIHLLKLFDEERIYLNKDLTIWELAKILGTNRTYLSQIINTDYGQNFSTFVNTYRARHADTLQKTCPQLSQTDIADLSGFGSRKSWKRAAPNATEHP